MPIVARGIEERPGFPGVLRALGDVGGIEARPGFAGPRRALGGVGGHVGAPHDNGLASARSASRSTARSDRKSTRLNSSHLVISYAVFCLKKNTKLCAAFRMQRLAHVKAQDDVLASLPEFATAPVASVRFETYHANHQPVLDTIRQIGHKV